MLVPPNLASQSPCDAALALPGGKALQDEKRNLAPVPRSIRLDCPQNRPWWKSPAAANTVWAPQPTRDSLRANARNRKQYGDDSPEKGNPVSRRSPQRGGAKGGRYSCVGSPRSPAREGALFTPDSDIRSSDPVAVRIRVP